MKLQTNAWVVVCDAGKFVLYVNKGDEVHLDLRVIDHGEASVSTDGATNSESPGQFSAGDDRRGGPDVTSQHDKQEKAFITSLGKKLNKAAEAGDFSRIVLLADKASLGVIRTVLSERVKEKIVAEIGADLARAAAPEVEAFITRAA